MLSSTNRAASSKVGLTAANATTPKSLMVSAVSNQSLANAGMARVGAKSTFSMQVKPTDVSFTKVNMRPTIATPYTWTWPNQTSWTIPTGSQPAFKPSLFTDQFGFKNPNFFLAASTEGLHAKDILVQNGVAQDYAGKKPVLTWEFEAGGNWTAFCTTSHPREFRGAQLDCQVGIEADNSLSGSRQGPYAP